MKKGKFEHLFAKYQLPLYNYLFSMCHNKQQAEDLLQETFYRAMISMKIDDISHTRAWLFRVARNLLIDSHRRKRRERKMLQQVGQMYEVVSSTGNPEQAFDQKTKQEQVHLVLGMLPEHMQTILYLREIQELQYRELAHILNLNLNQVKVNLHRARKKFKEVDQQLRREDNK